MRARSSMYSGASPNLHAASTATPIWSVSSACVSASAWAPSGSSASSSCRAAPAPSVTGSATRIRSGASSTSSCASSRIAPRSAGETLGVSITASPPARARASARRALGVLAAVGFISMRAEQHLQIASRRAVQQRRVAGTQRARISVGLEQRGAAGRLSRAACADEHDRRAPRSAAAARPGYAARVCCAPPLPARHAAPAAARAPRPRRSAPLESSSLTP